MLAPVEEVNFVSCYDLATFADPLERAVASLIHWTRLVECANPAFRLRVEDFDADLPEAVENSSSAILERLGPPREDVSRTYNDSEKNFRIAKPIYGERDYARLRSALRHDLESLCRDWNYDCSFLN
jgi:hypothetical protein